MPWFTCFVVKAGPAADDKVYVRLRPVTEEPNPFPEAWFSADPKHKKEILAVALMAIQTGFPVETRLEPSSAEYNLIENMYVIRQPGWK